MARNTYTDWFNAIRNNDLSLVSSLKKIKVQIENVKSLDKVEKTEAVELQDYAKGIRTKLKHIDGDTNNRKGIYYHNKAEDSAKYFDAIFEYSHIVIPIIDSLIETFNKEISEINTTFGKRDNDVIENNVQISRNVIRHNQDIVGHVQELSKYIPAIIEVETKALGVIDKGNDILVLDFFTAFNNLTQAIENKKNISVIFEELRRILMYLNFVVGSMKSLSPDYAVQFKDLLKEHKSVFKGKNKIRKNAMKFVDSVLRNSFTVTFTNLNDILKNSGTKTENGRVLLIDKLNDEKVKSKILEFLNTTLHEYYISSSGYDIFKNKINAAVPKKKGKFKEEEEIPFINNWNIASNLIMEEHYVLGVNKNIPIQGIGQLEYTFSNEDNAQTTMTFDDFKTKYLKDDKEKLLILREAIRVLSNLNNKKSVQHFLETQQGIMKYKKNDQVGGGFDNDDIKKKIKEIKLEFGTILSEFHTLGEFDNIILNNLNDETRIRLMTNNLIKHLIDNNFENILEDNDKYSCEFFEEILNEIYSNYDKNSVSDFLKLAKSNLDTVSIKDLLNKLLEIIPASFWR